jgi:uncharacterized protein (TIGR03437 family)
MYLRVSSFALPVFLISAALPKAGAVPITYTMTGYAQFSVQGQQINSSFTWTVIADTSAITNTSPGLYEIPATDNAIAVPAVQGGAILVNVTVYLNTNAGQVTFGNLNSGGVGLSSSQLKAWNFSSAIGPVNGTNFLVPGTLTGSDGTVVSLIGVANTGGGPSPTFQAALGVTPLIVDLSTYGNTPSNTLAPAQYAQVQGVGFSGGSPQVTVNGTQCPIFFATDNVLAIQVPSATKIGTASVVVQTTAGTSPPFSITINPTAPVLEDLIDLGPTPSPPSLFQYSAGVPIPTPSPGDRVYISVDGLGSLNPPLPEVQIDGADVPVLGETLFDYTIDGPGSQARPFPGILIQIPEIKGGPHTLTVIAGGVSSDTETFTVIATGLILSQTGLTFTAIQGASTTPVQSFSVLSGTGTISYSIAASTLSGGSWLSNTPSAGTATLGTAGSAIQVTANPTGLAAGTYYGQLTVSSPDVPNSPQTITIVLNILPAGTALGPSLDKTGLIFVGPTGGSNPPAQTINVFNPLPTALSFTSTFQVTGINPFSTSAAMGTVPSGQALPIQISASLAGVSTGTQTAQLKLTFSNGSVLTVSLLLVVAPGATSSTSALPRTTASCTATKLLPVFTLVGSNFSVPAAWPTPVAVSIVDNCGNPLINGSVILSFSNGDPSLRMTSNLNGVWSVTWPPANVRPSGIVLAVSATRQEAPVLTGFASISGGVSANPAVPEINPGGVVETAAYGSPAAPGDLIAIFGAQLSSDVASAQSLPLPNQLLSTSVILGGEQLPLLYTSNGQVNAMVPYDLPANASHQIIVQRGSSYSVPQNVLIGVAEPAVFTIDSSGQGQGQIYKYDAAGDQILVDANNPAKAGDVLVIYCAGLGQVTPAVAAGVPASLTSLTYTVNPVVVQMGGTQAIVQFSGLTPGFTGLYQVNAVVPNGLPDNSATQLQMQVSGQTSGGVTFAVQN